MLKVEVKGLDVCIRGLGEMSKELKKELGDAVVKGALSIEREAKINLGGRILKRRTGHLRSSVHTHRDRRHLQATVGTDLLYGKVHEYGATIAAKHGLMIFEHPYKSGQWLGVPKVRIPARPWLGPAAENMMGRIRLLFEAAVRKALRQ